MNQMEGFKLNARENLVYKLNMGLYRMKHKTDHWCNNFDSFKLEHGFKILEVNHCVNTRNMTNNNILHYSYMCMTCYLLNMKDLGISQKILGMSIIRN